MSGFVGITQAIERDISPAEREFLLRALKSLPTVTRRGMWGAVNALVVWAGVCLVLLLAWSLVGWLTRQVTHRDFGWHSDIASEEFCEIPWEALIVRLGERHCGVANG
jgi:hypothetical protein